MIIKNSIKESAVQKPFIISCGRQSVEKKSLQISGMNFPRDSNIVIIKVSGHLKGKICGE
ncbi:MAG: hypothetical protein AB1498_08025 [bacterium]